MSDNTTHAPATTGDVRIANPRDLTPHPRNARLHSDRQVMKLRESIREFGFVRPVVVDEGMMILAGHGATIAAIEEGLDEVPIHVKVGLTDEQKRAYLIVDNRLSELSRWDTNLLADEIEAIDAADIEAIDVRDLFARETDVKNEVIGGERFLLQIEVGTEKELEKLFDEMQERGMECKILS